MIPTGSIGLDIALNGGWWPGTLNEIWGDPGSGKTVLALHSAENTVRQRRHVLWIDTVDGVAHMDSAPRVIVARTRNAEQVFLLAENACREYGIDIGLVVIDSAEHIVRQRELDGDPGYVPHPQREYKNELTALKRVAKAAGTTVLFVSQPRDKEREPVRGTGISEKVRHRVHVHPDVVHQDGSREIQATVKDVPRKITRHDAARYTIHPGKGIHQARELVDAGVRMGIISQRGTWLAWHGVQTQGAGPMAGRIRENSALLHDLENEIRVHAGIS